MRSPIRRSKKIGLTQGGRVKNGTASEKWSRLFSKSTWETLSDETEEMRIIRENPSHDYFHPCSAVQINNVLDRLPVQFTKDIRVVVLRRTPTYDEWAGVEARCRYSCIILNAFPKDLKMAWYSRLTQAQRNHIEPWCSRWREENSRRILQWINSEIRKYHLYHLLLHEVGHIHDYYHHKGYKRREAYAENFALEWASRFGKLPGKGVGHLT